MPSFAEAMKTHLAEGSHRAAKILMQYIFQKRIGDHEAALLPELMMQSAVPELKLACFLCLAGKAEYLEQLSKLLKLEARQIDAMTAQQPRKANFPAVNALDSSCITKVLVYPFRSIEPRCIVLWGKNWQELTILAKLTGQSCLIGFDRDIEGDSWQLAAIAALIHKGNGDLEQLAFSGVLNGDGMVSQGDKMEHKQSCCQNSGLNLVHRVMSIGQLESWLNADTIPLPVLQLQGSKNDLELWLSKIEAKVQEKFPWFSYPVLEDIYGIKREELTIHGEGNLDFKPEAWQQLLASKAAKLFDALEYRVKPRKVLWYYAGQISTLQLGIGAIFGFKRAISIMQLDFSSSEYKEVFALYGKNNARELKNVSIKAAACRMVEGQLQITNPEGKELGLIIYLGSHNPIGEAKDYCRISLQVNNFLIFKAKTNQGVLELNEDWLQLAQEINSLLNWAREEYAWQRIHLFITAPTALCMALGIAIGHFLPVEVYHYQYGVEAGKYQLMFSLDKVFSYAGDER